MPRTRKVCSPPVSSSSSHGDSQLSQASVSSWHSYSISGPTAPKVKIALTTRDGLAGCVWIVVSGASLSSSYTQA